MANAVCGVVAGVVDACLVSTEALPRAHSGTVDPTDPAHLCRHMIEPLEATLRYTGTTA